MPVLADGSLKSRGCTVVCTTQRKQGQCKYINKSTKKHREPCSAACVVIKYVGFLKTNISGYGPTTIGGSSSQPGHRMSCGFECFSMMQGLGLVSLTAGSGVQSWFQHIVWLRLAFLAERVLRSDRLDLKSVWFHRH